MCLSLHSVHCICTSNEYASSLQKKLRYPGIHHKETLNAAVEESEGNSGSNGGQGSFLMWEPHNPGQSRKLTGSDAKNEVKKEMRVILIKVVQMTKFTILIAFFIHSWNLRSALPKNNYLKGFITNWSHFLRHDRTVLLKCQNDGGNNYKSCEVLCLNNLHFNENYELSLEDGADYISPI